MDYKALLEHGFEKRVKKLAAGLKTALPPGQTFTQGGGDLVVADTLKTLNAYLALGKAADDAEVALQTARQQLLAATPTIYVVTENLRAVLRGFHGVGSHLLEQYGIRPKKPRRQLKGEEIAAAGVRRAETRKIRGTLGPKEKLKLRAPKVELTFTAVKPKDDPEGDE